jgi:dihydrofolate synthase / folylpolyglutamate synthase
MNYPQAIDFLYRLRLSGTKLGLENTFALSKLLGDPHRKLRFIHVAGTNGKGSTCAMLESIYRHAGLRTGLFTSPHLVSFAERIQVNRSCIPEEEVARLTRKIIDRLGGEHPEQWAFQPTFFEFVTVMALIYFEEQNCQLVIWETGLGGRLDATNIVTPLASVITNIQFDHQHWLGSTLSSIAAEKAGIIKPGRPTVTGAEQQAAIEIISRVAEKSNSRLVVLPPRAGFEGKIALRGEHQRRNAAVAIATVDLLQNEIPVTSEIVQRGLETVRWPGRLQLEEVKGTRFLLDGAHNPDGARTLAAALKSDFPDTEITLIAGFFGDKAWQEMCDVLVPLARSVWLVRLQSERCADPQMVQDYCRALAPGARTEIAAGLAAAIGQVSAGDLVVIAGSLHLVGESMEVLGIAPHRQSERDLNEWNAAGPRPQAAGSQSGAGKV